MSSKSTATPENALSKEEIDERLGSTALARLASYRADGMIHLEPIWFDWDGTVFRLTLGAGRVHLKNLARDSRVSILVDQDPARAGPRCGRLGDHVPRFRRVSRDEALIRKTTHTVLEKALGQPTPSSTPSRSWRKGARSSRSLPKDWLTWDYNKGD